MRLVSRLGYFIVCLCTLSLGCESGTGPAHIGRLRIIAGGEQADTVFTSLPHPLVLQYRNAFGAPQAGVPVQIEAVAPPQSFPWQITVRRAEMSAGALTITDTTDSHGEVRVYVAFGASARITWVRFSTPTSQFTDSTSFTIRPGHLVRLVVGPADTATYMGNVVLMRAQTLDTWGNDRGDSVEWSVSPPQTVTLAGPGQVRGVQLGRGIVRARIQQLSDSVGINVVPPGRIAALFYTYGVPTYLAVFNTDGTGFQRIYVGADCATGVQWFPSGDRFVFARSVAPQICGTEKLFASTLAGVVTKLLPDATPLGDEYSPRMTLDGQWIYFTGRPDPDYHNGEIWRAHSDGSAAERIGPASGLHGIDQTPWPSPDGTEVVYASWREGEAVTSLRVVNTTTRVVRDLGVTGYSPSWSPDGGLIAFVRDDQYYVVRSDGSAERPLSGARYSYGLPDPAGWSPDGKWIVVVLADNRLALVNVETDLVLPLGWTYQLTYPSWRPTP